MTTLFKRYTQYIICFLIAFITCSCATRGPKVYPFVINNDMSPLKWADFMTVGSREIPIREHAGLRKGGIEDTKVNNYKRKLKPGDVVTLNYFVSTAPAKAASFPIAGSKMVIPVRFIKEGGRLKTYERDFLLLFIAINTAKTFDDKVPSEQNLVNLWNFIMNNIYVQEKGLANPPVPDSPADQYINRVMVDYSNIQKELYVDDGFFKGMLPPDPPVLENDIILPRTFSENVLNFFRPSTNNTPTTTNIYYRDGSTDKFFSFIGYTTTIYGVSYGYPPLFDEVDIWSVDDWIHSGIPVNKDSSNTLNHPLRYISIKGKLFGEFKIVDTPEEASWRVILSSKKKYHLERFRRGMGQTIWKGDLVNIFPSSIHSLTF